MDKRSENAWHMYAKYCIYWFQAYRYNGGKDTRRDAIKHAQQMDSLFASIGEGRILCSE